MNRTENEKMIRDCCRSMRISSRFAERVLEMGLDDGRLELIASLLSSEVACRNEARYMKRLNEAGFPYLFKPEEFDASEVSFPQGLDLEALLSLDFIEENINIIMFGNSGTGKTMLSIILGVLACEKKNVLYLRVAALLRRLMDKSLSEFQRERFQAQVAKASLIILDEFGYVPYEPEEAQKLFGFISEVNDDKAIILNTNIEFTKWGAVLKDDQLTAAAMGRMIHRCYLLRFNGRNRRLAESSVLKGTDV